MKPDTPSRERAMGEVMVLVFQIHGMGRSGVGYHEVRAGTGPSRARGVCYPPLP